LTNAHALGPVEGIAWAGVSDQQDDEVNVGLCEGGDVLPTASSEVTELDRLYTFIKKQALPDEWAGQGR